MNSDNLITFVTIMLAIWLVNKLFDEPDAELNDVKHEVKNLDAELDGVKSQVRRLEDRVRELELEDK